MAADDGWAGLMRAEMFDRAWLVADRDLRSAELARRPKHEGPRHLQRIWRGETLCDRHVLVRCYHGLGDTIQFCRFLAPLRRLAREVSLWCQPELIPLVRAVEGVDRVLPLHDGTPDLDYDVDIEIMELAHALRVGREQIAGRFPYLSVPRTRATVLPVSRPGERAVGLVWQAGEWEPRRSIPVDALKRLNVPGIRLYSLQRGAAQGAAHRIPAEDISEPDLVQLASRLLQLDLLVTVDSMPAHLAGALDLPVWTLLHADCDWRWPGNRATTAWYPSMRLFHQLSPGDWSGVMDDVALALVQQRGGSASDRSRPQARRADWAR